MKRITVLTLVFIGILFGAALAFAQSPQALIWEMTGTVELKASGSGSWIPARAGDRIERSTVISTGFKSTALLAVGSSTIVVRPLTRLSLEELMSQSGTETINIGLSTGRVRVEVKPPAGSRADFTVQTPSATASVRGTVFDVDPVNIHVIEGKVRYASGSGKGRSVQVGAGQNSQIDDSGGVVPPSKKAESDRSLPALPGQGSKTDTGGAVSLPQNLDGTLVIGDIIITAKE